MREKEGGMRLSAGVGFQRYYICTLGGMEEFCYVG